MESPFVYEGEALSLLVLHIEFVVVAEGLFVGEVVLEAILPVHGTRHLERSVNSLFARFEGVLHDCVADFFPVGSVESGNKN